MNEKEREKERMGNEEGKRGTHVYLLLSNPGHSIHEAGCWMPSRILPDSRVASGALPSPMQGLTDGHVDSLQLVPAHLHTGEHVLGRTGPLAASGGHIT